MGGSCQHPPQAEGVCGVPGPGDWAQPWLCPSVLELSLADSPTQFSAIQSPALGCLHPVLSTLGLYISGAVYTRAVYTRCRVHWGCLHPVLSTLGLATPGAGYSRAVYTQCRLYPVPCTPGAVYTRCCLHWTHSLTALIVSVCRQEMSAGRHPVAPGDPWLARRNWGSAASPAQPPGVPSAPGEMLSVPPSIWVSCPCRASC